MQFVVLWGYYLLFEGLSDGQTPGKRILGLRAVRDGGYSVGFSASAVRNLMRIVDLQPAFTYLVGITQHRAHEVRKATRRHRRGNDRRARSARQPTRLAPRKPLDADVVAPADRTAHRRRVSTARTMGRATRIASSPSAAASSSRKSRRALRHALPADDERRARARACSACSATERRAREQRRRRARRDGRESRALRDRHHELAALDRVRGAARRSAATRTARARRGRRSRFRRRVPRALRRSRAPAHRRARRVERRAVLPRTPRRRRAQPALPGPSAPAFAACCASSRSTFRRKCAARSRPIALAAAFLFGPAIDRVHRGRSRPERRAGLHPDADARPRRRRRRPRAQRATATSRIPQVLRPVMASRIIANNVQVTFARFRVRRSPPDSARSLLLLFNGVSLGGVFGLYASKGILPLLVAFVAPHGVLELSAICIAGGGGSSHRRGAAPSRPSHAPARARRERSARHAAHRRLDAVAHRRRLARRTGVADPVVAAVAEADRVG